MENVLFSIFMCARNAENTITKAINSVLKQTYASWELIIIDNGSADRTWEIVENVMETDSRVKAIRLENGIGWAKGASLCLEKAEGKYMTFLAADDFFLGNGGLDAVEKCIIEENPDIVWIGHINVTLLDEGYSVRGGIIPKYRVYDGNDKINEIYEIMNHLYYNSFFHFLSVKLLKNNEIDFFEPFYADYEGVTEAMCRAGKSVVLDQAPYALTLNTSQTSGMVTWKNNTVQWNSIKRVVYEKGCYSREKLQYIATRIMNNNMVMLKSICSAPLRDKEMNLIYKSWSERLQYIENALSTQEFNEMFYYAGRKRYANDILEGLRDLYNRCIKEEKVKEGTIQNVKWLDKLIMGIYEYNGEELVKRHVFDTKCMQNIRQALCNENNIGVFGYELVSEIVPCLPDDLNQIWVEINKSYIESILKQIYNLVHIAKDIKIHGRIEEAIQILKECMGIIEQIKPHVPVNDLIKVANELKTVTDI